MDTTIEDPASLLYQHLPLHPSRRQIRILTLQAGAWKDPICCDLSSVSLNSNPKYQALSYSWGTDESTVDITINDRPFPVRKNLHNVLRRLRRPVPGKKMVLWVDAICINQSKSSDLAKVERTSQVRMMATIYSHCREVLVWLGDCYTDRHTDRHHSVLLLSRGRDNKELLRMYADDFRRDPKDLDYCFHLACFFFLLKDEGKKVDYDSYELPPFWGTGTRDRLSRHSIPPTTQAFKNCYAERMYWIVRHVSESIWTTRVWTLQEYAVAPKVTICFGTAAVPLEAVFKVTETPGGRTGGHAYWSSRFSVRLGSLWSAFHRHQMLRNAAATFRPWIRLTRFSGSLSSQFKPLAFWKLRSMSRGFSTTVFECCAAFKDSEATDAHDKVFAIMSFMSFVGIQLPMDIDYDMAVEEVYIKVCSDQIQNCKGHPEAYEALAPLRFSRDKNKYRTLPSWVVDWTSYPRHNNHTNFGMPPKLSPDMVPWLHIESSPDLTGCRTVEPPTRMIGATRYNATKGLAGLRPSVSTAHVLSVSGMAIDRVCEITPAGGVAAWKLAQTWPIRDGARDKELRDRRSLVLRTLAADLLDKPVDWTQLAEFWGSLSAAFHVAETSIVEETNDGARTGPISLADVAMRVKELVRIRYASPEEAARGNVDAVFVKRIDELMCCIGLVSKGNNLFVTDSGQIGLGGKEIAVDDRVYVLYQGRTPFVLRQCPASGLRFRVVSECYVDGLMYGEAAQLETRLRRIEIE